MGTDFHGHLIGTSPSIGTSWGPRHFFETISFYPLTEPIFHTIAQIALSSNHILLVSIAYSISFCIISMSKKEFYCMVKRVLLLHLLPQVKVTGALAPLCSLSGVSTAVRHIH